MEIHDGIEVDESRQYCIVTKDCNTQVLSFKNAKFVKTVINHNSADEFEAELMHIQAIGIIKEKLKNAYDKEFLTVREEFNNEFFN